MEADKQSKKLLFDVMASKVIGGPATDAVEVINTCGWTRSGLATVSGATPGSVVIMVDEAGNEIPAQILSDGNIAFIAKDIPALGSKIFRITRTPVQSSNRPIAQSSNRPIVQSPNRHILTIIPVE